ncbi:hypothetical protein SLEP1_g53247 [Rubroshorea leprosula]|uniref:Uncharacterized protein n=1 Tax=Rubroshorea leprosula TaxID=152421 RepID=A0AAV5MBN4_9ROSI|nr:hypothetical protein SLEP1_g53247 [Rubroshorea leprosula]
MEGFFSGIGSAPSLGSHSLLIRSSYSVSSVLELMA